MADDPFGRVWLGLGSNLGDRAAAIEQALARLAALPGTRLMARSRLHRTPPWGRADQPEFLNAAAAVETVLPPRDLLALCQEIERNLGRLRGQRWGPRAIDLDIIHYEGRVLDEPGLTLPHPHWRERAFVLVPLAEIAPDLVILGTPVAAALAAAPGRSGIRPYGEPE